MTAGTRPTFRSLLGLAALVGLVWGGSHLLGRWQEARDASTIREISQRVSVTLYTTSTCPYCARAGAWLNRQNVRWRECNVETDASCAREYAQQGSPGVPLVRAGERWHLGFSAPWLAEALASQDAVVGRGNAAVGVSAPQSSNPSGASSPRP